MHSEVLFLRGDLRPRPDYFANKEHPAKGGYRYCISDEQLVAFSKLTPIQRLAWVEAAREFTWLGQTAETREKHERLRRGWPITR